MIFRFAIDPDLFGSAPGKILDDAVIEQHNQFLEMWSNYGVMVSDKPSQALLKNHLENTHLEIRKRWKKALTNDRFRRVTVDHVSTKPLWEAETGREIRVLDDQVQTVFVDRKKRLKFQESWTQSPEVVSFQATGNSTNLNNSKKLDEVGILPMSSETLWDDHFRILAEASQTILVVDKYAIQRWLGMAEPLEVDGLGFLIKKLSELPNRCTVKVISAAFKTNHESNYFQDFKDLRDARFDYVKDRMQHISLGNIRKLTFCLLKENVFRKVHFRFIRFDNTYVSPDKGLSVFDILAGQSEVQPASLKRYTHLGNVCKKAEEYLGVNGIWSPDNQKNFPRNR